MTTIQISLPEELRDAAELRARHAGFSSVSEYLCALLISEAGEPLDAETEAKLIEGLNSPAREVTRADWEEKVRQFEERLARGEGDKS